MLFVQIRQQQLLVVFLSSVISFLLTRSKAPSFAAAFSVATTLSTSTALTSTTTSFTMTTTTTTTTTTTPILKPLAADQVKLEIKDPVDPQALEQAKAIIAELRRTPADGGGAVDAAKLLAVATRLGDIVKSSTCDAAENGNHKKEANGNDYQPAYMITKEACRAAFDGLNDIERNALVNIGRRVQAFAQMQRLSVQDVEMDIPGGKAGHTVSPCRAAGCYAPGGRYPLPSSVIMTAVTARAAGCTTVVLCSPKPAAITLAAAHVAGVDYFCAVGGAQAIASMAYGVVLQENDSNTKSNTSKSQEKLLVPPCDVICGPGNQWVTAAKSLVSGPCGIDMLAGPSEVLVICDDSASAQVVAADLIAQAEHDVVARAILLSTSSTMIACVNEQLALQLASLPEPNQSTARQALQQNSFSVHCDSIEQCIQISDDIAPEHLEIQTQNAMEVGKRCLNYGGLFVGERAAEVLGDYGAGPNHTLPTGGTGRYTGGLSVFNFLRIRTWMRIDEAEASQDMVQDAIVMARLEGLEGHARAAETRRITTSETTPAFKKPKSLE
jgi:histidinol dehydrogenase